MLTAQNEEWIEKRLKFPPREDCAVQNISELRFGAKNGS